jgi:hypothetical protein
VRYLPSTGNNFKVFKNKVLFQEGKKTTKIFARQLSRKNLYFEREMLETFLENP